MVIITESTSCMTKEDAARFGVTLLSMPIVDNGSVREDEIGNYPCGENCFSLPPSEYDYYRAFYAAAASGENVISITISRKLSRAYFNAVAAAGRFEDKKIAVIDSMSVAGGQFLLAARARELERSGMPFRNIIKTLEEYRKKITLCFAVSDMERIRRSKRISTFSRGNLPILNQKPLFLIMNGGINYILGNNTVFGCIKHIVKTLGTPKRIVLHYSSDKALSERDFMDFVANKFPDAKILLRKISASVYLNTGDVICAVGDGGEDVGK